MDKQKQIEDLTALIDSFNIRTIKQAQYVAEYIVDKLNYRKIPENAVVLTREEWAKRNAEIEIIKIDNDTYLKEAKRVCELELKTRRELEKLKRDFDYNLVQERKQIRKETAEKFAEKLKEYSITEYKEFGALRFYKISYAQLDELVEEMTK